MDWIISANGGLYDHIGAFQRWGFIDWYQSRNYDVGDIMYIYCTAPLKRVMYKAIVDKVNMSLNEVVDDSEFWHDGGQYKQEKKGRFARLRLINQAFSDKLTLDNLKAHGLVNAPQRPFRVVAQLKQYIDQNLNDTYAEDIYPDDVIDINLKEGAVEHITVNRYERSSIARHKCVEFHGAICSICGMDFGSVYGEIGEGFIHVHHIVPLCDVTQQYVVDYRKDLIPVCPNCHAMLHRKYNGECITPEILKMILKKQKVSMN